MAPRSNIVVGLDIGTTNITVVVGEVLPDKKVDIIGVGTSPSRGLRKGVVINIEATVSSISKAVAQAETMAGCEIHSVFAGISGNHIKSFSSHGVVGIKNREVAASDIEKVIEAAKAVAIPVDREILHVLPQQFVIDGQDGIREPLGISGVRLEAHVHIITGAVASAQNIVKCANRCGLTVEDIVVSPLASSRAVLSPEELELGVCLVDIGGGTTDIVVFQSGAIRHTSVIGIGGGHITNDIAAGLRTPLLSAEKIKTSFASATTRKTMAHETIEVPSTGGHPPRVLSKAALTEIVEPRVVEIFSLIQADLFKSGAHEAITSGIVLTGGSAALPGMTAVAESVLNLPVRIGAISGIGGLNDMVKGPEFATAVGLILQGVDRMDGSRRTGVKNKGMGGTLRRMVSWFTEQL